MYHITIMHCFSGLSHGIGRRLAQVSVHPTRKFMCNGGLVQLPGLPLPFRTCWLPCQLCSRESSYHGVDYYDVVQAGAGERCCQCNGQRSGPETWGTQRPARCHRGNTPQTPRFSPWAAGSMRARAARATAAMLLHRCADSKEVRVSVRSAAAQSQKFCLAGLNLLCSRGAQQCR